MLCCEECSPTSVAGHSFILTILLGTWYNLYYRYAATTSNWYSEINVTFYSVTLARTIWLPDDGPRTETCRSVLKFKFINFIYVQ